MELRAVKLHKMFRDFHEEKEHGYVGNMMKTEPCSNI
ncbi:hypothetical protein BANRA_02392 [Acinetobacter baumannii]|nr:hypothetical protein BANRA_02392 [Acinetobacter baumannii]